MHRSLLILLVMTVQTSIVTAENWPCWRGPRGDGTSLETNLPQTWDGISGKNIAWKVPVPYSGHSSPIVWNDQVFVTGTDEANRRRMLMQFDRNDGRVIWERQVDGAPLENKHKLNSWASGTPATDGSQVYVTFLDQKEMLVAAYDFEGEQKWIVKPGVFTSVHGYCSCPVLFENLVIVNGDHDGDAYIVALNRDSGNRLEDAAGKQNSQLLHADHS